ncbi:MAG: leucine-rich repeat domain-containing protein [Eubacteriales bacterium]|nr:leucine-rich repeat domain-containing protein [Eubacteriales bacterium]
MTTLVILAFTDNSKGNIIDTSKDSYFDRTYAVPVRKEQPGTIGLTYEYRDGVYVVTGCTTESSNINIPSEYDDGIHGIAKVTAIAESAFIGAEYIVELQLPSSLESIGENAFNDCINIETIYFYAIRCNDLYDIYSVRCDFFKNCGTEEKGIDLIIGSEVTRIPGGFSAIETLPQGGCKSYTYIKSINFMKGSVCAEIGNLAFPGIGITELNLPESVKIIKEVAFLNCTSLEKLYIPGVKEIRRRAFYKCEKISEIIFSNNLEDVGSLAFEGTPWLEKQKNDNYNGIIGNGIFYEYTDDNIIIPDGVLHFSGGYHIYKHNYTSIQIPEGVLTIGYSAVCLITLKTVYLPASLVSIGDFNFPVGGELEKVYYAGSREEWEKIKIGENNGALNSAEIIFGK